MIDVDSMVLEHLLYMWLVIDDGYISRKSILFTLCM